MTTQLLETEYIKIHREYNHPKTLEKHTLCIYYKHPKDNGFNPTEIALAEVLSGDKGKDTLNKTKTIQRLREVFTEDERFEIYLEALRKASK